MADFMLRAFLRGLARGFRPAYAERRALRTLDARELELPPVPGHRWHVGGASNVNQHVRCECGYHGPRRDTFTACLADGDAHIATVLELDTLDT